MPQEAIRNLKPAPFALTPATVASLVSSHAPIAARMELVPLVPTQLVDQVQGERA